MSYASPQAHVFAITDFDSLLKVTAFNQMIEGLDAEAPDGIHFSTKVAAIQADIVLNLACNDKLPQTRPFKQVCGATIPVAKWSQVWVLAALSMSSLAVLLFHASGTQNLWLDSCDVTFSSPSEL